MRPYDKAPRPPHSPSPVSKLPLFLSLPVCRRSSFLRGGGGGGCGLGAESYDRKKAGPSINRPIISGDYSMIYRICGTSLLWFKNYLAGRSQYVDVNGTKSDPLETDISVIQGSTLGPILFLCYINPILHTVWLDNHALTLKSNSTKYYFYEKSRFLHTFLKFCCESRKI